MKAALLTALAVPLIAAPALARADVNDPPPIFTRQEQCDTTRAFVDTVRGQHPDATPEQIADAYLAIMDSRGAYRGIESARERDRRMLLDNIATCGL
ncbi:hypothetical protein NDR87_05220 [Nocardia sp. CDC159]|uniref:Hemophore-related protein n=1 Tax=Nocardia pulmonis TaxID=2951408 RepID=A0A9X2E3F3_9NOCA|nr:MULTISPECIES: hypothetical protein [Nocardia]MCM6772940.1 hypothetical protein [Nocardia pulmonis]MCM6785757.1 hypothetical protein [Nocardia sp. CDC159]